MAARKRGYDVNRKKGQLNNYSSSSPSSHSAHAESRLFISAWVSSIEKSVCPSHRETSSVLPRKSFPFKLSMARSAPSWLMNETEQTPCGCPSKRFTFCVCPKGALMRRKSSFTRRMRQGSRFISSTVKQLRKTTTFSNRCLFCFSSAPEVIPMPPQPRSFSFCFAMACLSRFFSAFFFFEASNFPFSSNFAGWTESLWPSTVSPSKMSRARSTDSLAPCPCIVLFSACRSFRPA